MDLLNSKATQLNVYSVIHKKSYTLEVVNERYTQRFEVPIINDSSYKKGVYTNFSEFKNNHPSITEYEWKADKKIKVLYIKDENQHWVPVRKNIFGFSDGKYLWVRAKNNFYPVYKKGNTFEFFGSLYLREIGKSNASTLMASESVRTSIINNVLTTQLNSLDKSTNRSIYEINMDNGEFQ